MRTSPYIRSLVLMCTALLICACADKSESSLASESGNNDKAQVLDNEEIPAQSQGSSNASNAEHSKKIAGTSPAASPGNPTEPASPSLATPSEVMSTYLADAAADGTANSPTIGRELHKKFAEEKRDKSWAEYVEPQVNYYLEKQRATSNFMTVAVQCRETMCEILAVNRSPTNTSADVDRWQQIIYAMKRERWYTAAQILEPAVEFGSSGDGRVAILTYLIRG